MEVQLMPSNFEDGLFDHFDDNLLGLEYMPIEEELLNLDMLSDRMVTNEFPHTDEDIPPDAVAVPPDSRLLLGSGSHQQDDSSSPSTAAAQLTPSSVASWLPGRENGSQVGGGEEGDVNNFVISPSSNISPTTTDDHFEYIVVERPKPQSSNMNGAGFDIHQYNRPPPLRQPASNPFSVSHPLPTASTIPAQDDAASYQSSFNPYSPMRMNDQYSSSRCSSFINVSNEEELEEMHPYSAAHDFNTDPYASVGTTFEHGSENIATSFAPQNTTVSAPHAMTLSADATVETWQFNPIHSRNAAMQIWPDHGRNSPTNTLLSPTFQHGHVHHVMMPGHEMHQHQYNWQPSAPMAANALLNDPFSATASMIEPDPQVPAVPPSSLSILQSQPEHLAPAKPASLVPSSDPKSSTGPKKRGARAPAKERPIAPVDAAHRPNAKPAKPSSDRRGGRRRGMHLGENARSKAHLQRKIGACWRCALQRDPCDGGDPCQRCLLQSQRGQSYYFPCSRARLTYFVQDFLPLSMTSMHQKQTIEDDVKRQVSMWDKRRGIDVQLTCGYGPNLTWRLYEFQPVSDELTGQLQYFRDETTGQLQAHKKWSLPLGIIELNTGADDAHFENFLQEAISEDHLWDFGWTCFEEETQTNDFQAKLLQNMCDLYIHTTDVDLHSHLAAILRMMLITYIMGHTLTVVEHTRDDVLSHIRYSNKPYSLPQHSSPRLANRQLKFFFSILRNKIYDRILNWQQQALHNGRDRDGSWLSSFCVTLGFAMVLEEVQQTLQIQANAKIVKNEMSREEALTEAANACERIDDRFELLVGLFRCKYRSRQWASGGTFGHQTPTLTEEAQVKFAKLTRQLLDEKVEHLKSRRDVKFGDNQCLYTSRLVARFLLPFTTLPP